MKSITVSDVMQCRPCEEYTLDRVSMLFGGRKSLAIGDIAALPIPATDRIWVIGAAVMSPDEVRECADNLISQLPPGKHKDHAIARSSHLGTVATCCMHCCQCKDGGGIAEADRILQAIAEKYA